MNFFPANPRIPPVVLYLSCTAWHFSTNAKTSAPAMPHPCSSIYVVFFHLIPLICLLS
jgi:hypothetical protein